MAKAISASSVIFSSRYSLSSSGAALPSFSRCWTCFSLVPNRAAMAAAVSPSPASLAKRLELVGRMHRQPDGVLGQADLQGALVGDDLAGHREILWQLALGLQFVEGGQAARARDDKEEAVAGVGDDQVLHQAVRQDRGFEFLAGGPADGAAGIARRLDEPLDFNQLMLHK